MIIVSGLIEVAPEYRQELIAAAIPYVQEATADAGNIEFYFGEDIDVSGSFYLYQEWASHSDRSKHLQSSHAQAFRTSLAAIQILSIVLKVVEGKEL
ncbi:MULTISPECIES: putative quinol monooxygenase [Kordiimonas]|uniref:putative quinol monooxygenase n=1 Tax=Kordiimonas TaxID=288021 RepID=UPI00257E1288|nr:antibiotic biosynthesis monooxygenase [Kordiimonas sp. UBA4487]